jgi:hypothetical protein
MYGRTRYRRAILSALALLAAAPPFAWAATDEAYMCRNRERERRVELQHADAPDRLPCQVVYWRDATRSDGGLPIWEATHDFGFCIEQTRDLVQRLQQGGWTCQKADAAHVQMQTIPALAPSKLPIMAGDDRGKLGEALARDLQRLAQLTPSGTRFEIESTELGDLDQDGKPDAAVLLNFQTGQPDQPSPSGSAQFLMAYRFDGGAYYPIAKTHIGGADTDVVASSIERIEDGAIEVLLEVRQQGDLECCPSGRRREAYVLQDGNLVARRPES